MICEGEFAEAHDCGTARARFGAVLAAWPPVDHALFRRRALKARPELQARSASLLHQAWTTRPMDPLEADETVLGLLRPVRG